MNAKTLSLRHERVDDIPLLVGFLQALNLPDILERHLGSHHLHQGLSNGWLATVWIAFLLSQSNHRKVSVQDWARGHPHTLEALIGAPLRPVEFSDDRLSIILRRLHDADWAAFEADLWNATCQVYEISYACVRLDATTSFGYHEIEPDGIMQRGHSKDHRPDLPQLKLMAAVAQPTSQMIACDIVAGNAADDPLYLPLIRRVRGQLRRQGLLYAGDCKMAALETRADLAANGDYYLMPLPRTGKTAERIAEWVEEAVTGAQPLRALKRMDEKGEEVVFARAYETEREQTCEVEGRATTWRERAQVVRSLELADRQARHLEERLRDAEAEVRALTPPVGRGRKQHREEETLRAAIAEVLTRHDLDGLLTVKWQREEQRRERYRGRGRGKPGNPTYEEVKVRYAITKVRRAESAIQDVKDRQGWRVQVTNMLQKRCGLRESVLLYNGGWSVERDFHMLKDRPLGIQPFYVREQDQIIGMTRLLTIALRVLTLSELQVRNGLAETDEKLSGLYEGQPGRKTGEPTTDRLLRAISRMEITATRVETDAGAHWQVTDLPPLLRKIMKLLDLSPSLYADLAKSAA